MYEAELLLWKQKLEQMPEELFVIWQNNALLSSKIMDHVNVMGIFQFLIRPNRLIIVIRASNA